jgi:hypothetical protein
MGKKPAFLEGSIPKIDRSTGPPSASSGTMVPALKMEIPARERSYPFNKMARSRHDRGYVSPLRGMNSEAIDTETHSAIVSIAFPS